MASPDVSRSFLSRVQPAPGGFDVVAQGELVEPIFTRKGAARRDSRRLLFGQLERFDRCRASGTGELHAS